MKISFLSILLGILSVAFVNGNCCSQDGATCISWGGNTKEECINGQNIWLPHGALPPNTCITRWNACTFNTGGCCPGLACQGNYWWKGCEYVPSTPPHVYPPPPTTPPTKKPVYTPPPTNQPVYVPPPQTPSPTQKPNPALRPSLYTRP